uniref:Uncharacterized protein n=2 Tax=Anguilla anguilla TaxID=7936 RepID=A0A0E9UDF8_ANGAN
MGGTAWRAKLGCLRESSFNKCVMGEPF